MPKLKPSEKKRLKKTREVSAPKLGPINMTGVRHPLRDAIRNVFLAHVHAEAVSQLTKTGFKLVGGSEKALDKKTAFDSVDRTIAIITPDGVMEEAVAVGAIGDGAFLQRVSDLLKWIVDHKEQILQVVKIILSLIALFGEHQ